MGVFLCKSTSGPFEGAGSCMASNTKRKGWGEKEKENQLWFKEANHRGKSPHGRLSTAEAPPGQWPACSDRGT